MSATGRKLGAFHCSSGPCGATRGGWRGRSLRPGISLAEMMIAIVILGLGLLMVATLFPVSWLSARRMAEHTTTLSCVEAAHRTMETLLKVDGAEEPSAVLLPGDYVQIGNCDPCEPNDGLATSLAGSNPGTSNGSGSAFPRVHVLNLGNILYEGKRQFVAENVWDLERTLLSKVVRDYKSDDVYDYQLAFSACGETFDFSGRTKNGTSIRSFLTPIAALQDRVYPPLSNRPTSDFQKWTPENQRWDQSLSTRRYAWSAFYRFSEEYVCNANIIDCGSDRDDLKRYDVSNPIINTRVMTMYYVTLRRPRANLRYARQDPAFVPHPDPREAYRDGPTQIAALGADKDLMLPVPWRVQVLFPDDKIIKKKDDPARTFVATEITVNDAADGRIDPTPGAWVTGLFDRGTLFIDELNGQVYRVEKRRLTDDDTVAHLTLDREVVFEELNFLACGEDDPKPKLDDEERLRTVWVFAPPVLGGRSDGDPLTFEGSPPVVDISVRTLTISP